jgi:glycosyltransferase involved in cell wall biosynthesis
MRVAVLLPSYKPGWYLERCLDSIDSQSLHKSKFKLYIALNGPKDEHEDFILNLLRKYTFDYEYLYLEKASVSGARNALIDTSIEEYIAFVDDDDVLSVKYLEKLLVHVSDEYVSISNVLNFSDSLDRLNESYIGKTFLSTKDGEQSLFKSRKFFSSPWAKLIHRKIIGSTRFDIRLKTGEDALFMANISKRVKGVRKADMTACYYVCQRDDSASRRKAVTSEELRRISYLVFVYSSMLFRGHNTFFILSRIIASIIHVKRIFR